MTGRWAAGLLVFELVAIARAKWGVARGDWQWATLGWLLVHVGVARTVTQVIWRGVATGGRIAVHRLQNLQAARAGESTPDRASGQAALLPRLRTQGGVAAIVTLVVPAAIVSALLLWQGLRRVPQLGPASLLVLLGAGICLMLRRSVMTSTATRFATGAQLRHSLSRRAAGGRRATSGPVLLGTAAGARRLYAGSHDVVLVVASPQTGKTAWMGGRVIDAAGAVVATSTKTDLCEHTVGLRAAGDRLVDVLNPEGLAGIESTFRWSPIEGCIDALVANQRAGYLLAGSTVGGTTDPLFWQGMNVRLLRCLLFAAATSGRSMYEVWSWVGNPNDQTPLRVLERESSTPPGWEGDLRQIMDEAPERTRESVYLTLSLALQFMIDPQIAQAVCPLPGDRTFSVREFIDRQATLYLIGSERPHGSLAPLFTALTGHIFESAKQLAAMAPAGRLSPALTLALDEAALICPVPLDRWSADSGGRGISLLIAVQSPSQLYERWGERGGQTIFNNANAKLIFGGLSLARDLDDVSRVCGERDEPVRTFTGGRGASASVSLRRVPVLAPHEIRQLGRQRALLLYRHLPPVIVTTEQVWQRQDVRAWRKSQATSRPVVRESADSRPVTGGAATAAAGGNGTED